MNFLPLEQLCVRGGGGGGVAADAASAAVVVAWYLNAVFWFCGDECVRVTPSSKFELNILIGVWFPNGTEAEIWGREREKMKPKNCKNGEIK